MHFAASVVLNWPGPAWAFIYQMDRDLKSYIVTDNEKNNLNKIFYLFVSLMIIISSSIFIFVSSQSQCLNHGGCVWPGYSSDEKHLLIKKY